MPSLHYDSNSFAKVYGAISTSPDDSVEFGADASFETRRFPFGMLASSADVSVADSDSATCAAFGTPRFADASIARLAESDGAAAAWLRLYDQFGTDAPKHVQGRFAAIFVGRQQGEIAIVTDRLGTLPICYTATEGRLYFADRADSVPVPARAVSNQAIFNYLYFHVIPGPETVFEEIHRAPAASVLQWSDGRLTVSAYWKPEYSTRKKSTLEDSAAEFRDIVESAIRSEISDGAPTATFLSGGTDSSTVAGMLSRVADHRIDTYSIGFDATGYDEMHYARIAAQHFDAEHHDYYVTPEDLLEGIPRVARFYDQPFGNSSAVPAWICASRAKADGFERLLAGDGGDELFGGNTRYAQQRLFGVYDRVPSPLRSYALEPVFLGTPLGNLPLLRKVRSYIEQAKIPMPDRMETWNLLERIGTETIFEPDFLESIDGEGPRESRRSLWKRTSAPSSLEHQLAFEWQHTLIDNDLPKVSGTCQLADIDVRFPLLNEELVAFAHSLPASWKLKGLKLRWFFKYALKDFLPTEIIHKKKQGFGLPFGVWASTHDELRAFSADTLAGLGPRGIVKPEFIDDLLQRLLPEHPGFYGEMVWILLMLELWLQDRPATPAGASAP